MRLQAKYILYAVHVMINVYVQGGIYVLDVMCSAYYVMHLSEIMHTPVSKQL